MENWAPIPGWEDRYAVSDRGRVRSCDMHVACNYGKTSLRRGRILKLVIKSKRYLCVTLTAADGSRQQRFVHDLVALTFIGPKPATAQTRHLDDDKLNNWRDNIAYGSAAQNTEDAIRNGKKPRGENNVNAALTNAQVHAIRAARNATEAARVQGIHYAHAWSIRARRTWKHLP